MIEPPSIEPNEVLVTVPPNMFKVEFEFYTSILGQGFAGKSLERKAPPKKKETLSYMWGLVRFVSNSLVCNKTTPLSNPFQICYVSIDVLGKFTRPYQTLNPQNTAVPGLTSSWTR